MSTGSSGKAPNLKEIDGINPGFFWWIWATAPGANRLQGIKVPDSIIMINGMFSLAISLAACMHDLQARALSSSASVPVFVMLFVVRFKHERSAMRLRLEKCISR